MIANSALYVGTVMHRRLRPKRHRLHYRVFWMLLDLDEIDMLDRKLRLFSRNRFNALSFRDADHMTGSGTLRDEIEHHLQSAGLESGGAIRLFCMPRIFGYGFNPLSIFFCYGRGGVLIALLYEVHNTFGQRHSYLIPLAPGQNQREVIEQTCGKGFYVSPFLDMDMRYAFRVEVPAADVKVTINGADTNGPMIAASLSGERRFISDAALLRLLLTHPLLTLKVIAAIHWQALRMLLKGFRLVPRPSPPSKAVTIVAAGGQNS